MKDDMGVGAPVAERSVTLDDIEAAVDAISDGEITRRLHEVLARAMCERLGDLDAPARSALSMVLAGAEAEELLEVKGRLRQARQQLHVLEAELDEARRRRDEMLRQASAFQRLLTQARWNLVGADPGDDPYITEILKLGQEVLDHARAEARSVRQTANDYADRVKERTDWRVRLGSP